MVAGDHHGTDPGVAAFCDSKFGFFSGRIHKACQADKYHIFLIDGFVMFQVGANVLPAGEGKYTQGIPGKFLEDLFDIPPYAVGNGFLLTIDQNMAAAFENDLRRAFGDAHNPL